MTSGRKEFSLLELNACVRNTLQESLPERYWVRAEISEARIHPSGHCYLELIEKEEQSGKTVAKARATIWATTFRLLQPWFEQSTGQLFTSGIKILIQVSISFHELYGYNLTVHDIDPAYTLGDAARRRAAILQQLREEGVADMNKELTWPILPQRIAVISSPSGRRLWRLYESNTKQFLRVQNIHCSLPGGHARRPNRTIYHSCSRPNQPARRVVRWCRHHSGRRSDVRLE